MKKNFSEDCNEVKLEVQLSKGQKKCNVVQKEIGPGEKMIWKGDDLSNCQYFDMDNTVQVSVKASYDNIKFCPLLLIVELDDRDISQFRAQFDDIYYDTNTNEKQHNVKKFWLEGKFHRHTNPQRLANFKNINS